MLPLRLSGAPPVNLIAERVHTATHPWQSNRRARARPPHTPVLWEHIEVRMLARDGQHSGKLVTHAVKFALRVAADRGHVWETRGGWELSGAARGGPGRGAKRELKRLPALLHHPAASLQPLTCKHSCIVQHNHCRRDQGGWPGRAHGVGGKEGTLLLPPAVEGTPKPGPCRVSARTPCLPSPP